MKRLVVKLVGVPGQSGVTRCWSTGELLANLRPADTVVAYVFDEFGIGGVYL